MSSEGNPTTHPTRLRQIALLAPTSSFPRAKHLLTTIFSAPILFVDPAVGQFGLENFLIPLGGDIIEVVSPLPSHPGKKTTAGRLLEKRGITDSQGKTTSKDSSSDGMGYMIIMQNLNASLVRSQLESGARQDPSSPKSPPPKVIFSHPFSRQHNLPEWRGIKDESQCIQYHPQTIKGGMMPELDSHTPCAANPMPLETRFSPWHACGGDYARYSAGMRKTGHLHLLSCKLRLAAGDTDVDGAVAQWSGLFGVSTSRQTSKDGLPVDLAFTNSSMRFVAGEEAKSEGLVSITVGVDGKEELQSIKDRARKEGVWIDGKGESATGGWVEMVGVKWYLVSMEPEERLLKAKI